MSMYYAPAFFAHLLGKCLQQPTPRKKVPTQGLQQKKLPEDWQSLADQTLISNLSQRRFTYNVCLLRSVHVTGICRPAEQSS